MFMAGGIVNWMFIAGQTTWFGQALSFLKPKMQPMQTRPTEEDLNQVCFEPLSV